MNYKVFDVNLVVVHGGKTSHQDEEVACAIAFAFGAQAHIVRRDPAPEELSDPRILVMDVGGQHDPARNNFDHHQRGRDEEPKCAYALVAEHLGIRDLLAKVFTWFEPGILVDATGPFATAAKLGVKWSQVEGLVQSPASHWHHQRWAEDMEYRAQYTTWLGMQIVQAIEGWQVFHDRASLEPVGDLKVLVTTDVPSELLWLTDAVASDTGANVVVFNDDRGSGYGLLRRNDDPRVDFSSLDGRQDILFAHKGGFIAKTVDKTADWRELIRLATKQA